MHEWIELALGIIISIASGLLVRLLRHLDDLEDAKERHAREIRDTRQAVSRIEGRLDMGPFPYSE